MLCYIAFQSAPCGLYRSIVGYNELSSLRASKLLNSLVKIGTHNNFRRIVACCLDTHSDVISSCTRGDNSGNTLKNAEVYIVYPRNIKSVRNIVIQYKKQFLFSLHLVHYTKSHIGTDRVLGKIESSLIAVKHKVLHASILNSIIVYSPIYYILVNIIKLCRCRNSRHIVNVVNAVELGRIGMTVSCEHRLFKVYVLGGDREAVEEAVEKLGVGSYGLGVGSYGLKVVGIDPVFVKLDENQPEIVERINAAKPDILFVALGNPKQELWMGRNAAKLDVGVLIGIGGTFNFLAGRVKRAPRWMQKYGLEWVYRIIQEPGRLWRRYAYGLVKFSWLSLLSLAGAYRHPADGERRECGK